MIFTNPVFYDIFGALVFIFIIWFACKELKLKTEMPKFMKMILLIIGIVGLFVELSMVYLNFFI